ncbi:OmpA family protein [Brevundimonas sp.]|uniref:OmpA family protein n=1 Tax=Brevundimonas sp. TaxID=1871086 RepID=UPI00198A863F|nr:OmpA family protein [Brevundimonas sp.]MBD3837353.1 OmpA family protein [Brevundimonas sp.]
MARSWEWRPGRRRQDLSSKSKLRTAVVGGALIALGFAASGCASHRFVRDQVEVVDNRVMEVDGRVTQVEGTAGQALERANAAHKLAEGKFLYQVVLSDDSVKFPTDASALSPEAEQRLGELAQRLKAENRNVYLEIQGYTDSAGDEKYNEELGAQRAEAVRRYMSLQGIALNRMATISYGEAQPVAPNNTREGRAQNRRVAIVVLT